MVLREQNEGLVVDEELALDWRHILRDALGPDQIRGRQELQASV